MHPSSLQGDKVILYATWTRTIDVWCVHISGPSVIQASSAAVSTDAFGGTSSLRQRLARSLITTTANSSSAGNLKDTQGTSVDWAYNFRERPTFRVFMTLILILFSS